MAAVKKTRTTADVVTALLCLEASPYWHSSFDVEIEPQRAYARDVAAAGAHVVPGHHPHVVHGIEIIPGCVGCYSLGNFVFHSRTRSGEDAEGLPGCQLTGAATLPVFGAYPRQRDSVLDLQDFVRRGSIDSANLPVWLDDAGEPYVAVQTDAERIFCRLEASSRIFVTFTRVDKRAGWLAL